MKITCVFVQYPQRFEGELMPNLYAAADEWLNDDNPDYLAKEIAEVRQMLARGDIADYSVTEIEVPDGWVQGLFTRPSVKAAV